MLLVIITRRIITIRIIISMIMIIPIIVKIIINETDERSTCCSDGSDKAILRRARGIWSGLAQKRVAPVMENQRHHRSSIRRLLAIIWPGRFLVRELALAQLAEFTRAPRGMAATALTEKARALLNGNAVDRGALEAGH